MERKDKDSNEKERFPNSVSRANQYTLSSKFFNDCRNKIKKNEYDVLINTLKSFNKSEISKEVAFEIIGKILKSVKSG